MKRVRGTQELVKNIEVNVDTVYIRTDIRRIETENFVGWEYEEQQFKKDEYIENLTSSEDSGMLALIVSMLMSEVDMLKSMITGGVQHE